jgi:hypothetical protein
MTIEEALQLPIGAAVRLTTGGWQIHIIQRYLSEDKQTVVFEYRRNREPHFVTHENVYVSAPPGR